MDSSSEEYKSNEEQHEEMLKQIGATKKPTKKRSKPETNEVQPESEFNAGIKSK